MVDRPVGVTPPALDPDEQRRVLLVRNEQVKLLATALNTAATSSLTIGVLAPPIVAAVYATGQVAIPGLVGRPPAFGFRRRHVISDCQTCYVEPAPVNDLQIFAFVILPAAVVALAWGAMLLNERIYPPQGR